jgi:hypothetical protein
MHAIVLVLALLDEVRAELRIQPDGEKIAVDLKGISGILKDADPSEYEVLLGGTAVDRPDPKAATIEFAATPGGEVIVRNKKRDFVLTVSLVAGDKRRAYQSSTKAFGEDVVVATVCNMGDGGWHVKSADVRYPVWAEKDTVTLDGMPFVTFPAVAKGKQCALVIVPAKNLTAALEVAQQFIDALLKKDFNGFSALLGSDREKTYWNAARKSIENAKIVKTRYRGINSYQTTEIRKKLMFDQLTEFDEVPRGGSWPVSLILEDGKWVIEKVTP